MQCEVKKKNYFNLICNKSSHVTATKKSPEGLLSY